MSNSLMHCEVNPTAWRARLPAVPGDGLDFESVLGVSSAASATDPVEAPTATAEGPPPGGPLACLLDVEEAADFADPLEELERMAHDCHDINAAASRDLLATLRRGERVEATVAMEQQEADDHAAASAPTSITGYDVINPIYLRVPDEIQTIENTETFVDPTTGEHTKLGRIDVFGLQYLKTECNTHTRGKKCRCYLFVRRDHSEFAAAINASRVWLSRGHTHHRDRECHMKEGKTQSRLLFAQWRAI